MERRAKAALVVFLAALAWIGLAVAANAWDGRLAAIAVFALPLVVALAHQYRRWKRFRSAVHLVAFLVAVVVGTTWFMGPTGVTPEPLGTGDRTTIRIAAAGLLFLVLLELTSIARN